MIPKELTLDELIKDSNYKINVSELRGQYKQSYWNLIPKDSIELLSIPIDGYTFTKYGSSRKKPKLKKFKTIKAINYGTVTKSFLEILINKDDNLDGFFGKSEGVALCYGLKNGEIYVIISGYYREGDLVFIYGDGSGGGSLTPCGIPPHRPPQPEND